MGASFLITLREGLEIALVIAVVTAYLVRSGRRSDVRHVLVGSGLAAAACIVAGVLVHVFTNGLDGKAEQLTEGLLAASACIVLTWMIFWMRRNARTLGGELRAKVDAATTVKALTVLAFVAVAREGFETVLFLMGAEAGQTTGSDVVVGGIIGLAVAAVIGTIIYAGGQHINLGTLFKFTGVLVILFAAGLAGKAVHELREFAGFESGWLISPMWEVTSGAWASGSFNDFVEGLFGWSAAPERIRVLTYFAYVIPVMWLYLTAATRSAPAVAAHPSAVTAGV
jgi:high-affinity iron transporter